MAKTNFRVGGVQVRHGDVTYQPGAIVALDPADPKVVQEVTDGYLFPVAGADEAARTGPPPTRNKRYKRRDIRPEA